MISYKSHTQTFSLQGRMWECVPKDIWQQLFNLFRKYNGNLDHMYDLLIDYQIITKWVFEYHDELKFIWMFDKSYSASNRTSINKFEDMAMSNIQDELMLKSFDYGVVVTLTEKEFTIEFYEGEN